jgi:hypothetical protein
MPTKGSRRDAKSTFHVKSPRPYALSCRMTFGENRKSGHEESALGLSRRRQAELIVVRTDNTRA